MRTYTYKFEHVRPSFPLPKGVHQFRGEMVPHLCRNAGRPDAEMVIVFNKLLHGDPCEIAAQRYLDALLSQARQGQSSDPSANSTAIDAKPTHLESAREALEDPATEMSVALYPTPAEPKPHRRRAKKAISDRQASTQTERPRPARRKSVKGASVRNCNAIRM